ncbi:MAG: MATE family efflux transporter [Acidiferrobacterales bacterium]|nr:MATE family efflux transporter [Acidiferrobacterales bacterium]
MISYFKEIKALVPLALPVSLAHLAMVGMGATDVLIAGQAGTVELAGMNLGSNIWNMISLFFMGVGFATQPLVAKQFGRKSDAGIKHQFHQSLWLCFVMGLIATLTMFLATRLLLLVPYEEPIRKVAYGYMLVMVFAALPATLLPVLRGTLEAMNLTRIVFSIVLLAFLLNIPLDYALVNGLYGFPKLGGVGCALASMLLIWLMLLIFVLTIIFNKQVRHRRLFDNFSSPDKPLIKTTFKLGIPIGVSIFIELSMFSGAGILIAAFGAVSASAHAVALTIASLTFMLYFGVGQGITIRASQHLGAQLPQRAWHTIKVGTSLNLVLGGLFCIAFLWFDQSIVQLFSSDVKVIKLAIALLVFAAIFQIADALQVSMICALRAYQDTSSPPKYQFFAFWIFGLPLGVALSFYAFLPGFEGAKGLWLAMVVSLFIVGLLLLRRLILLVGEQPWSRR